MKTSIHYIVITLGVGLLTGICPTTSLAQTENSSTHQHMNTFVSIFEIPATDLTRAVAFYQAVMDIQIETIEIPDMAMGIFPYENQVVTGVITKGEDFKPSADGVTIYLNGGDDLQPVLDRVEMHGGKIIVPKTPHADESGFFALFLDSEGNKMGLHSIH